MVGYSTLAKIGRFDRWEEWFAILPQEQVLLGKELLPDIMTS